jgi:tetratricopeptide (TPR) repeat protein
MSCLAYTRGPVKEGRPPTLPFEGGSPVTHKSNLASSPNRQCLAFSLLCALTCSPSLHFALPVPEQSSSQAQLHAEKGIQASRTGDLPTAEQQLREAVKLAPNDPFFLSTLGSILGMEQKLPEASLCFEKAVKIDPSNVEVRRHLAATQWQLGRFIEARKNLEYILSRDPNDKPALLLAGMVAENLKDYSAAAKWLSKVPELVDQRPEAQLALGRSYYKLGQQEDARKILGKISGKPADAKFVFWAGQEAFLAQDFDTAEALFLSIQPSYADQASLGYAIARVQYQTRRYVQAQKTLSDLTAQGLASGDIYSLLGWCQFRQGQFDEAVRTLERAIKLEPQKEGYHVDLGTILAGRRQKLTAALQVAKVAAQQFPDSYQTYQLKGLVETRLAHYQDAVQSYLRAQKLNPSAADVNVGLAVAQWGAGLKEEALATFERGLQQFPKDPEHLQEYARVLSKMSEQGDGAAEVRAISLLKKAIVMDNSQPEPFYQLGSLELAKGNAQEAVELLKQAAELDPKSSKVHFALSRALRRLSRQEDADKEFQLYESLKGDDELSSGGSRSNVQ